MGLRVGEAVGDAVGLKVGLRVGEAVGDAVGLKVGLRVGEAVGDAVGLTVVGLTMGAATSARRASPLRNIATSCRGCVEPSGRV